MKSTLPTASAKADGNSRRCFGCPLRPCSGIQSRICSLAFREGFRKGAAWKSAQLNSKFKSE